MIWVHAPEYIGQTRSITKNLHDILLSMDIGSWNHVITTILHRIQHICHERTTVHNNVFIWKLLLRSLYCCLESKSWIYWLWIIRCEQKTNWKWLHSTRFCTILFITQYILCLWLWLSFSITTCKRWQFLGGWTTHVLVYVVRFVVLTSCLVCW